MLQMHPGSRTADQDDCSEPLLEDSEYKLNIKGGDSKPDCIRQNQGLLSRNESNQSHCKVLALCFLLLIIAGLGTGVMQKAQTKPMKNYPYFLSLLTSFIFIPASFAYIVPMGLFGRLSVQRKAISQIKVFNHLFY